MATPDSIERRINDLEASLNQTHRSLRRARTMLAVFGIAGLGLMVAAMADLAVIDTIRTKRLEIVDDTGNVLLAASSDGAGGRLDLWTPDGCNVMRLAANPHGGDLAMWNCDAKSIAGIFATSSGGEVSVWDTAGGRAARLRQGDEGGTLELLQASNPRVQLRATSAGATMGLLDPSGQVMLHAASAADSARLGLQDTLQLTSSGDGSEVIIQGSDGDPVATLGNGMLLLAGDNGQVRMQTGAGDLRPMVSLTNAEGKTAAHMTIRDSGSGVLAASSSQGEQVASLRTDPGGNGRIDLSAATGEVMATMQTTAGRGGTMALMSPNGKMSVVLAASSDGGVMNLTNGQGVPVVVAGIASGRRDGALSIFNHRGIPVVSAGSTVGGLGQLTLNDDNGHRLLRLPTQQRRTVEQ